MRYKFKCFITIFLNLNTQHSLHRLQTDVSRAYGIEFNFLDMLLLGRAGLLSVIRSYNHQKILGRLVYLEVTKVIIVTTEYIFVLLSTCGTFKYFYTYITHADTYK